MRKILQKLALLYIIILFVSCGLGEDNGPAGMYYSSPDYENYSFISFGPPNEYHSDYITWTGNRLNDIPNCKTKGSYVYNKGNKTLIVSDFYNSNCKSISDRNGTWQIKGNTVISPTGVKFSKR